MEKRNEISIKHVVDDRSTGIYIKSDILKRTIIIGRGMKRRRFTLWEAECLEFLLKRQIDRLKGDYPKEAGSDNNEFLLCPNCGKAERHTENFCGNCGYNLSSAPKRKNGTACKEKS